VQVERLQQALKALDKLLKESEKTGGRLSVKRCIYAFSVYGFTKSETMGYLRLFQNLGFLHLNHIYVYFITGDENARNSAR